MERAQRKLMLRDDVSDYIVLSMNALSTVLARDFLVFMSKSV